VGSVRAVPPPIVWPPERVTALYEQVAATLRQTAALAERDAERAGAAADVVGARVERARAERAQRAAEQARANALRLRARASAERVAVAVTGGASFDHPTWWPGAADRLGERFAVIATDPAGTVRVWNREAERLYGWPAREVLGRAITEFTVGPEDAEVAERIMAGIRRTGCWEGEFFVRRRDGTRFLAFVHDVLVRDHERRPVGIVGFSVELSPPPAVTHDGAAPAARR
jgi:PAS domain S-box-containing protein